MNILVIGGTGFIGRFVVRDLVEAGHDVTVYHRGKSNPQLPRGTRQIIGDRAELGSRRAEIAGARPDVVIDCILSSGAQATALMDIFRGTISRIVILSSQDVYRAYGILLGMESGELEPVPLTEDSPLRTRLRPYPAQQLQLMQRIFPWLDNEYEKIEVERAVANDSELPATVLRLPMVYGPGDPLHRLYPIVKRVEDGRQAILLDEGSARWRASRGYVENVATAIAIAATSDRATGRTYNIAESTTPSELEWTQLVARAADWRGEVVVLDNQSIPAHLRVPSNTAQDWIVSSERIRGELGVHESVPTAEALRRTIEWETANPPHDVPAALFDYPAEDAAIQRFRSSGGARNT